MRRRDRVLYHPYDSFAPVVALRCDQAAADPDVLAIKQTLYRVGPNSPIVEALMEARRNGKQVAVLVELKARFDEENNIDWARALEEDGVHVVYGVLGLKTHAKMCLVVRRERDGIAPLRPPRHRQLQRRHRAHLHRPRLLHLRPEHRRGRLRPLQRADRLLAQAPVPQAAGGAGQPARGDHRAASTARSSPSQAAAAATSRSR